MMKGGYGYKIRKEYLSEALKEAERVGTKAYTDELTLSPGHIVVSCDFAPGSPERKRFDDFLRLLYVREKSEARSG